MIKLFLSCFFLVSISSIALSQTTTVNAEDSISIKKIMGVYYFYQGDTKVNMKQIETMLKPNNQAWNCMKSAKSTYSFSKALRFAGSFLVGWTIGAAISGEHPDWTSAGVGAVLIVVAIPLKHKFNKNLRQAVELYNSSFHQRSSWQKTDLKLKINGVGAGLVLSF